MVSAENTAIKYRGQMAANYVDKRSKQLRWKLENEAVLNMLLRNCRDHKSVLDVPCGEGRFLKLFQELKLACTGYDTSEEMLKLARRKRLPGKLAVGSIYALSTMHKAKEFDVSICVRFLDLVPEEAMRKALTELAYVSKYHIICTIRLGPKYIAKSNTATHDTRKFTALCNKLGFAVIEEAPIFQQGWKVLTLERASGRKKTRALEHTNPRRVEAESGAGDSAN